MENHGTIYRNNISVYQVSDEGETAIGVYLIFLGKNPPGVQGGGGLNLLPLDLQLNALKLGYTESYYSYSNTKTFSSQY